MQTDQSLSSVSSQASGSPDYSLFSQSIHIPFTNRPGATPAISVKVNDTLIEGVGLDTGSTVFALRADLVPDFGEADRKDNLKGSISYRTSRRLWKGYWFEVKVTLEGIEKKQGASVTSAASVTSKMKILVITEQTKNGKPEHAPIHYMGIAFGKLDLENGYTPDKNPLVAVTQYNNEPINDNTFRRGYIIRERSIDVGLIKENTESFKCTKLTNNFSPGTEWYWDRVRFALSLDNSAWMLGEALVDIGVSGMEIDSTQYKGESGPLKDGTVVTMHFPDENSSLPKYSFKWQKGDEEPGLPESVEIYASKSKEAFVNTGVSFYEKFDTLFDPVQGFWGVRERQDGDDQLEGAADA